MNYYSSYNGRSYKPAAKKRPKKMAIIAIALALVGTGLFLLLGRDKTSAPQANQTQSQQQTASTEPQKPALPNLQPLVDEWVASKPGTYSILITDTDGKVLASHQQDEVMFAASIYKLYVAYVGYQKIADGTYEASESYNSGYTRLECLDEMIRSSFSPCAEKMWAELGKQNLTEKMEGYGLKNTSLTGLQTTAADAAIILQNIYNQKDLTKEHRDAYLDSMKTQDAKYRRGLPSGFKNATVYNKVGWNLDQEWHDTAVIEIPGKPAVIVSVFTNGAGYQKIAAFGSKLEAALQ